jgi:hypothetical protein
MRPSGVVLAANGKGREEAKMLRLYLNIVVPKPFRFVLFFLSAAEQLPVEQCKGKTIVTSVYIAKPAVLRKAKGPASARYYNVADRFKIVKEMFLQSLLKFLPVVCFCMLLHLFRY